MNSINRDKNNRKINSGGVSREFAPVLRRVCVAAWVLKLVPIPMGLWNARLLSRTVSGAVSGDSRSVLVNGAFLLLLFTLLKIFDFAAGCRYQRAASQALHRCKLLLYRRFLSCPLALLYGMEHGQAVELLNDDFNTVTERSLKLYPGFFTGLVTFTVCLGFLLAQNRPAAFALLGISILQVIPPLLVKRFMQESYSDTRDIEADITDCTLEYYHGFTTIKIFDLKQWCLDRLARLHKDYLKIGNRSEAAVAAENALDQLIENILTYGTYGLIGIFVLQGYTSLDAGVEALALSRGFFGAVKNIFETIPSFAVARTAERRLAALGENDSDARSQGTGICFEGVSCSFDGRQILSDVHVSIPAGQISLIRGANGIGKSTLLKLALGMVRPDAGSVSIDGMPSQSLSQDEFPGRLFYLPQEDAAFHISAKELYEMVPGADAALARSFAGRFCLSEESLSQPIDTLSGGQRKKVFLALALAVNPDLMLLDEPTNSLDAESREILAKLLQERQRGTVIITHDTVFDDITDRFYTIQNISGQFGIIERRK